MEQLVVRMTTATGKPAPWTTLFTINRRGFPFFSEWRKIGPGELAIRYPKAAAEPITRPFSPIELGRADLRLREGIVRRQAKGQGQQRRSGDEMDSHPWLLRPHCTPQGWEWRPGLTACRRDGDGPF